MGEIFAECVRVIKDEGVMTLMFTHKSQDAWEVLTRSLIENGWIITTAFPVESEGAYSSHQMDTASGGRYGGSGRRADCRSARAESQVLQTMRVLRGDQRV